MVGNSVQWRSIGARLRIPVAAAILPAVVVAAGVAVAAGGNGQASASASTAVATSGSCTGVAGAHHARLVVEPVAGKVVARCVGFSGKSLPGLTLLKDSHIEFSTQTFSFGVAICQVDDVPAHYTKCLPTGQDYWALFLSTNGHKWTSPSVGISDIKVPPGGSVGLRYDSPKGTPAPPPHPTPA